MDSREIFQWYVRERRDQQIDGFVCECLPHFTRHVPKSADGEGMVMFANLPTDRASAMIDEQIEFFEAARRSFEWKVYEFDAPANLRDLLARRGFVSEPIEGFLVLPLGGAAQAAVLSPGVTLRRIDDDAGIDAIVSVQAHVWGEDQTALGARLKHTLARRPAEIEIVSAFDGPLPVAVGWIDFTPGSGFADLHGGSVLPGHRGRGIYTALLAHRIAAARARGCEFLCVDAAPMSRPILLRKGFQFICETWPMKWKPPPDSETSGT